MPPTYLFVDPVGPAWFVFRTTGPQGDVERVAGPFRSKRAATGCAHGIADATGESVRK